MKTSDVEYSQRIMNKIAMGVFIAICASTAANGEPPRPLKINFRVEANIGQRMSGSYSISQPHGIGTCGEPPQSADHRGASWTCEAKADAWEARDVTFSFTYSDRGGQSATLKLRVREGSHSFNIQTTKKIDSWHEETWNCGPTGPCSVNVNWPIFRKDDRRR